MDRFDLFFRQKVKKINTKSVQSVRKPNRTRADIFTVFRDRNNTCPLVTKVDDIQ